MSDVKDTLYIDSNSNIHRVSSVAYSSDCLTAETFCRSSFEISDKSELEHIHIRLLRNEELCVKCERDYQRINYNRFNFDNDESDYIFYLRFSLRYGDDKGGIKTQTVSSNCEEDARNKIENEYDKCEIYEYEYISKYNKNNEWIVTTDNRKYRPY